MPAADVTADVRLCEPWRLDRHNRPGTRDREHRCSGDPTPPPLTHLDHLLIVTTPPSVFWAGTDRTDARVGAYGAAGSSGEVWPIDVLGTRFVQSN